MHQWNQLLIYDVQELHDAQMRLLDVWPKMAEKATNPWLKDAFAQHGEATERQVARLEQMARLLMAPPDAVSCKGMKGLITEAGNLLGAQGNPQVLDAALVGAARKFEHYGLAAYYTTRLLAQKLDLGTIVALIEQSLAEVIAANGVLAVAVEGRYLPESLFGAAGG